MNQVIIGMGLQRAYLHNAGSKYIGEEAEILKVRVKDFLENKSCPIFYTREIHCIKDTFFRCDKSNSIVGSLDIEIVEMLKPFSKLMLNTSRYNAFYRTPLESELKKVGPDQVVLIGVETHSNILFTAEELRNRGYDVLVIEALTQSRDAYMHASGINILSNTLSVDIE